MKLHKIEVKCLRTAGLFQQIKRNQHVIFGNKK